MKYIVWFGDYSMGYGFYIHLIGIFDTKELAEDAIKKVEANIEPYIQKYANAKYFEMHLAGVNVNEIGYPIYEKHLGYKSNRLLGGYEE